MLDTFYQDTYGYIDEFSFDGARSNQERIAIVGLPNSGKKLLINSLYGWDVIGENDGSERNYGLIQVIDLPENDYEATSVVYRLESSEIILFVLDAAKGLNNDSFSWVARLRSLDASLVIVLSNAVDIPASELKRCVAELESRTARPVLALTSNDKSVVQDQLLVAMLKLSPDVAVPLASEIPSLRGKVARQTILQAVAQSMALSLEMGESGYAYELRQLEMQLVRRIASIYGYNGAARSRDRMLLMILLRWASRRTIPLISEAGWMKTWMRTGLFSGVLTLGVGYLALLSYGISPPAWLLRFTPQSWKTHYAKVDDN